MRLEQLRERLAYQPLLLGAIALVASAALAFAAAATRAPIAAAEAKDLRDSLAEVLPPGFADNDFLRDTLVLPRDGGTVTVYRVRRSGRVEGAVFKLAGRGYAADIQLLIGVDRDGRALGVRVVKHAETPGLGDKIEVAKSAWIRAFDGRALGDPVPERWAVKKDGGDFDQFAGATVTPRAVVRTVRGGLEFFAAHRAEILGEAS
ncbi:RnfABCDGE type electron transport complex subunit G [Azospira restricta]|uniref:Ion-translocating oxidoreductase complex subunit G n=1 Tax=Azospira restricta TaxID=404405 RepID=A0A974Y551_9RHOO|nr:RnfABCDGE type electron transport complex subunit G [Azospira restricta]QRJ65001.1 RnfABCDGE type electron transport complex subunit G [Azospira restricta]